MYTQFQRFVATLLLFSILLQSCGNPNWKMVEPVDPAASDKKSKPSKAMEHSTAKLLQVQEGSIEGSISPKFDLSHEVDGALSAEVAYTPSVAPSRAAHGDIQLSTSPPTPARSLAVPTSNSAQAFMPSSGSKKKPQHNVKKPRHAVLSKAAMSQRTQHQVPSPPAHLPALPPACAPQPLPSTIGTWHQPQTEIKPSTDNTVYQSSSCVVLSSPLTLSYPIAQGHQVRFEEQAGVWVAQVQDVWGRVQKLPVVCAPDQSPTQALQKLASKTLGQYKYCVHILETNQPPWAPRVVYVGALGLRGGGQVGSALKKIGRVMWGVISSPVTAIIYAFKEKIPPLPCRVTTLHQRDEDDLQDSSVDNSCQAAGEWVSFFESSGYWYARTSKGNISVKSNRSASLSLEDLVNSRFSIRKFREKSFGGYMSYGFWDYNKYDGLGYELELITSPEEVQSNKEARRRQRREAKRKEEERRRQEAQKREEAALRREAERIVREEAQRQQELEQKKEAERAALVQSVSEAVSANFYDNIDQLVGDVSEEQAAYQAATIQRMAAALTQGHSREVLANQHEIIKDGYLSDDELDHDLADNTGSGFDFGPTDDHLPVVEPEEEKKEEVPPSPETLAERLLRKQQYAQACDKEEHDLQRGFHVLLQETTGHLTEWQNILSEDFLGPSPQDYLQDLHEKLLALPEALNDWEKSLQSLGKSLKDWASSLHQPTPSSWRVDLDLDDYQDMFSHYQAAEKVLTDEKGAYQALLQEVLTCLSSPHYYTVLTTPQLRQQAMSLAQALAQVANDSAVTQAHALQRAEQACERARSRDEKVQGQLETARKKWVRKQVEVIAHTLNHKPLLDYLAGKDRGYINEKDAQGRTALHCAVAQNQPDFVQWLLDHGADVEVQDADKCTPLHWAAQWGYSDMAAMLLVHGAAIESQDADGFTPLHWAAQEDHTTIVELLLEKGAAIEAQDEAGLTPLHAAVQQGHTDTVELLLTRGANKEAQDSAGCTPLHWAAQQSHPVIAELLLVRGADPTAKDTHGKTPHTVAISKGHQLEDPNRKALLKKVEEMARSLRHWPLLYYLAGKGPQYINEQDAQGQTALHCAVAQNQPDVVQWLLDHGADVEVQDENESPLLHWAANNGHEAIVERLLKKGADTEARGLCEFTPLRYAVREGNEYTATLPPRHNEKVEAGDAEKNCPLHYAAAEGHKTIVELLLAHGANKDAQGSCACTPLHYAVWEDHKDVAALLLDHGAKIEIQDTAKHTPLHYAACKGHTAIVELLLARGAAAGAKDKFGITPLAIAIAKRHEAVATLLRAAQVPSRPSSYPLTVSVEDEAKNTDESIEKEDLIALHYAINQGPKSVVATPLVNKKAAIDEKDEKVWKVSHHAGSPKKYFGGIPNVGNTCYLNAALQIIARLYPDLVGHPHDYLGKDGQAIVNKLTSNDPEQRVTEQEATAFRNDLINSYNQGKSTMEQLRHSAQEDVAPVLSFLLQKGRIQEIAFYATKNPVGDDAYTPTMADSPSTGQFITVNLPSTGTGESMDRLVESTLRGNLVEDTVWERDGQVTRGRAEVGTKLSMQNLQGLTHKIVPICAHRFVQTSNQHSGTASKIETPITNPFKLTIAEKYLIGEAAYTSSLVGFIYHAGDLNSGHYMVYIKNKAGKWIKYNDATVTELSEQPLREAQKAYLYFYQTDSKDALANESQQSFMSEKGSIASTASLRDTEKYDCDRVYVIENMPGYEEPSSDNANHSIPNASSVVSRFGGSTGDSETESGYSVPNRFFENSDSATHSEEPTTDGSETESGYSVATRFFENLDSATHSEEPTTDGSETESGYSVPNRFFENLDSATHSEEPTTDGSGNGEDSSCTSFYGPGGSRQGNDSGSRAHVEQPTTDGSGNGEDSSCTSFYGPGGSRQGNDSGSRAHVEQPTTDGSGNGEDSSCTSFYGPGGSRQGNDSGSRAHVEQPTTGGSRNGEDSSCTSVYTMPEWIETTTAGGSGNGEDSSCTSVYTMVPEWRESTTTDGSGNSETSHNTQPKSPTTAAVQDQKLEQTEQTLQKSQARPEKAQAQLETTREQWIHQQVVAMAHDLNHQPLLDYLAGKGNNVINEPDEQGKTALHHAVVQNKHDVVQWLLAHGAAIDNKDADGLTLLHWAALNGHTAVAELLLAKGADIQAENNVGDTPLHWAAEKGHTAVAELLLAKGADSSIQNRRKKTALDIAIDQGQEAVATLLRAAQVPGWRPQAYTATTTNTTNAVDQTKVAKQPSIPTATTTQNTLPKNVKDAPELAQAKSELRAALDIHKAAQKTAEATAKALQEAQSATEHARAQSQALVLHLQTTQQHVTRLVNAPPAPRSVAFYLQSTIKEAQDYLQALPEANEVASEEYKERGNALLVTLYTWRQQERQHHRHVEQLFLCDATLGKEIQVQLLGEILPQYRYHIDTLSELIKQFVETGHIVAVADAVSPLASLAHEVVAQETTPLHDVISEQNTELLLRIVRLGASLPESLRENFQTNIAPILEEKLLQVSSEWQERVFHYFQQQGTFYPKVLRQYPVEAWVLMSLFHDLAQGTSLPDTAHLRFNLLAGKLKTQYPADVLTDVLWALRDKKVAHGLSLDELCDVMDMLPEEGAHAQALLCLPASQWHTMLKQTWLLEAIEGCCSHLSMDQRQHLIQELSYLGWSPEVTQTLLEQLPQDHDPESLSRLLAFVAQHPIDDEQLLEILQTPASSPDDLIAHWHYQLACSLLQDKLPQLLPQEVQESTCALIEELWTHVPAYQSINIFLEHLLLNQLQEEGPALDPEHLHLVLAMMRDYRLDEATYTKLLQQLTSLPSHQWSQHFYTQVLQQCFAEEAHERTVPEIIDYMAHHSPAVAYVQDRAALAQAYQAIIDAYQGNAKTITTSNAIKSWDAATITKWAQVVKDYSQNPGKGTLPTQTELIAVVKRAVELCHVFPPRNTQLLSLLVLLNTKPDRGRLVQINTGEGKSLTVAMFSAIKALLNNKSDIVTTSTELSIPEVNKQRPFFKMLALSVAENSAKGTQDSNNKKKQQAYQQDHVYGTPADFQGDILQEEFFGKELRMRRPFDCVVVDEVDNMLFDSRSHSIRLTSSMPATNYLEVVLAATWQNVKHWSIHLITDQGRVYYIKEDFYKDENGQITILSGEERDPNKCRCLIEESVEEFIQARTRGYIELLLRDLSSDEKAAYEASKKLEREISLLRTKLVNEKDPDNYKIKADQLEQLEKDHQVLPWNADKKKYPPTIVVPVHLKELARRQVPRWIQSAINAALVYKKGCHYDVHDGKIVPVDYDNTGVWQHNMVWSNGLAQFLQIKEGLKVSPENICTNFISTVGFFRRYAQRLYGLTGTLGNETTQEFFKKVYNTDLVIVPPYKQRLIVGNADSRYACKELTPQIITNKDINKWYDAIEASALQHAQQQRAVLIICKYIRQVHALEERLQRRYTKDKIFTYTGKKKFTKGKVYPGEVVIATNIAGRGTDLTLDALVEHHGGLHVCITFLPESYRVELQNAGRTARQGSKGTTQLILHQPEAVAIAALRQQRDEQEAEDLQKAIDEVKRMTFKDELFQGFCRVENKLIPTLDSFERMRQSQLLKQLWEAYTQDSLSSALIADRYERHVDNCVQTQIDAIPATQWSSLSPAEKQVQKATIAQAVRTENSFSEFQQIYTLNARKKALQKFQKELGDSHTLHRDVVTAFEEGREYIPENGALAVKHGWGPHERKAVEERFGLWFHKHVPQGKEPIDVDKIRTAFKEFIQEIEADAQANNLIHNPFFYVQKGNYLLQSSVSSTAIAAYDKAIALDPDFSLHARYNKAMALLEPEENKHRHSAAKEELQEAKLLVKQYRDSLFIFQGILGLVQPPKPQTAQHLQHHLDILFQQDNHIDAAIGVITSAQDEGNHVKITKRTEVDALFDEDAAQEHREQALAESYENGLAYFFTIEEKKPRPWLAICVVALIGLVQIAAATLATVGTAGLVAGQLLKSGISDIVTAISSAISGKFSWREWGISKAISVGISIFYAGITHGWSSLKDSFKEFGSSLKEGVKALKNNVLNTRNELIAKVKEIAFEVGKGVGKECVTMLLNQGIQEIAGEALEERITQAVSQDIMDSMLKSDFIKRAMANDIAQGRDYWAQIFIKEGLAMLNEQDSVWHTILQGIIKGTALQKLIQHIENSHQQGSSKATILVNLASVGLPMLSGVLEDIHGFTDSFLANFHARLEQKYRQDLANMEVQTRKVTEQQAKKKVEEEDIEEMHVAAEQEFMHVLDAQEHFDDDELQLHDLNNGQAFSTQAKVTPQQAAIDPKSSQEDRARTLGRVLTSNISARLLGKVNQHLMSPLTSRAAGAFVDVATSGIAERLREQREIAVEQAQLGIFSDNHVTQHAENQASSQDNVTPDTSNTVPQSPEANNGPSDVDADRNVPSDEKPSYREGNVTNIAPVAIASGMAMKVSKDGKSKGCIGTKNRHNGVIELVYITNPNPTDGNHGHYMVRVNGKIVDTSGDHNGLCLYNAVFAGMPEEERQKRGITSGEDLYHKSEAHRLAHPEYAQQADRYYQTMLYRDPDALMRGAGVWADAATGLQGVENWLDAHPALLSLMKNTGSVVGGAIWLSKLTPAGLVTGLVVNYGYEKLLKLMEGNIEVAKEHLTTYFQAYDEDITPEQASYLANCAMKVLQTAGQIAVHQAAARGFQAVKKGVGAVKSAPKVTKAAKEVGKVEDAAKSSATLRPVGIYFESVDDIMANPSLLNLKSYAQIRGILNGSRGWVNDVMNKTRGSDKGWILRQVNSQGQPTGRLVQYHPGSRRHFDGKPYWKVTDGTNTFRFPAD